MENDANPYAPPTAEPPRPAGAVRPRVVKWATFVLGVFTVGAVYLYWQTVSVYGVADVWKHQSLFDLPLFIPVGFLICLFRRRGKASFWVVAALLGWMCLRAVERLWPRWTAPQAFSKFWIGDRIVELLFAFGLLYLFYRFTFGRPSRLYFGMARPQPVEEPSASPASVEVEAAAPASSSPPARWRPPPPDPAPYGKALAECVADKLERGKCVTDHHRDFCGMGLWFVHGHYCYDESWDGQPPDLEFMLAPNPRGGRVFKERAEFVEWLAAQSDHSLAGFEKEEFFHQNSTITRKRLWEQLGCR